VVPEPRSDPFGVDPEEALVASVASCHMLWFLDLARRAGLDVASYDDDAAGEMGRVGEGRYALTIHSTRDLRLEHVERHRALAAAPRRGSGAGRTSAPSAFSALARSSRILSSPIM
jgi:organic hydroperoxide reductase OsmC/OhrA